MRLERWEILKQSVLYSLDIDSDGVCDRAEPLCDLVFGDPEGQTPHPDDEPVVTATAATSPPASTPKVATAEAVISES